MAKFADVADVFYHAKVGIEAEGLREVSGLRSRLARRSPENFGRAACRLHHSRQNLKRGRLARAVGADQAEDFAASHLKSNSAHGLDCAVVFPEVADVDRDSRDASPRRSAEVDSGR